MKPSVIGMLVVSSLMGVLTVSTQDVDASPLTYIPLEHWSYQAFYRLSSLGLLPLHAISARPITRLEAQRLVREASLNLHWADSVVVRLAREDLRRLAGEFSTDSTAAITLGGLASSWIPPRFKPNHSIGASSVALEYPTTSGLLIYGRAVADGVNGDVPRSELYASFQLGSVFVQAGKSSLWWGPSLRSGLLLSDNAGPLPLVRFTAELPQVRLTKVVASLERTGPQSATVLLFATRLDWSVTPRFRLGLSENVVTTWGPPLTVYHLLHPLPVFLAIVANDTMHDILGLSRNHVVGIDFDWLLGPGVRLYGELMIDDIPNPFVLEKTRLGLLGGLYLLDPFGTGGTSLRLEYSGVTNGTYSFAPSSLEYARFGRSLGHWLGPDGDDLYVELTHQVNNSTTFQLSYAYTRHGQGSIGLVEPGSQDWFLSGIVERRHTLGFQLHTVHSPSLETRYTLELASVTNRGNVAGVHAWEGLIGLNLTYRWPVDQSPLRFEQSDEANQLPPPPNPPSATAAGRVSVRSWSSTSTFQGALSSPPAGQFLGIGYRTNLGSLPLSLAYDAASQGDQSFWSADLHYSLAELAHGTVSVFAGWGGIQFRGALRSVPQTVVFSGPRVGADFYYRLTVNGVTTPFYLIGDISTNLRGGVSPIYLWTYTLGLGWYLDGIGVEAGYRGAAGLWQPATADQTMLRWDGLYVSVSFR